MDAHVLASTVASGKGFISSDRAANACWALWFSRAVCGLIGVMVLLHVVVVVLVGVVVVVVAAAAVVGIVFLGVRRVVFNCKSEPGADRFRV